MRGSSFNVVVTNTEKIRIQKQAVRKKKGWTQLQMQTKEQRAEEVANRRLQTIAIASLSHLGVFSNEAHHTYGLEVEMSPFGYALPRVVSRVEHKEFLNAAQHGRPAFHPGFSRIYGAG